MVYFVPRLARLRGDLPQNLPVRSYTVKFRIPSWELIQTPTVMIEKKIGCLPVVENRVLRGILTEGDLLAILSSA